MAKNADTHRILKGSELKPAPGTRSRGRVDPTEAVRITLCLRRRPDQPSPPDHTHWMATPPLNRKFLSTEEFAAKHGASHADLAAVTRFARDNGLEVVETSVPGRTVVLSGSVGKFSHIFGMTLKHYEFGLRRLSRPRRPDPGPECDRRRGDGRIRPRQPAHGREAQQRGRPVRRR